MIGKTNVCVCRMNPTEHAPVDVPVPRAVQPAEWAAVEVIRVQGMVRGAHHQLAALEAAAEQGAVARVAQYTRGVERWVGEAVDGGVGAATATGMARAVDDGVGVAKVVVAGAADWCWW